MLEYTCETCRKTYPASIGSTSIDVRYKDGENIYKLENDQEPCHNCDAEIKEAAETARQRIKERSNGRQQNGQIPTSDGTS